MSAPIQRALLFDPILDAYDAEGGEADNAAVYQHVAQTLGVDANAYHSPVGEAQQTRNIFHRDVRFAQQTLRSKGLISRIGRGQWTLTQEGKQTLTKTEADRHMVAFSTELGVALWGNALHVFDTVIHDDIHLCLTSPPYLGITRSYGTYHDEQAYIDFLLAVLTPIREKMAPGANLALNISNDSVLRKQFGARSLYLEMLILALAKNLDLVLMDRLVWHAPDKAPKGYQVTHQRTHLTSRHEPILWFCNAPEQCLADNRRVLTPYNDQMKKLIANHGEQRARHLSDYHPNTRVGGFSKDNGGSIPSNILTFPTRCRSNQGVKTAARTLGLPVHGALYPVALADHLIRWLCPEYGLVVDPFGGYATTAWAAEQCRRRWATCELHWEYLRPALTRFIHREGYSVNPLFKTLDDPRIRHCA